MATPLSLAFVDTVRGRVSNRGFSTLFLPPSVSSVISVRSENGVGGIKSFAQRHRGHRGFLYLCLLPPFSLAFVDTVRGRVSNRGFSTLFLPPSVSSVISVRSENGVGGIKSFARRHRGHRGFYIFAYSPLSPWPLWTP